MITGITTNKAKPFLKWAGGKTQLLTEIDKRLPKEEILSGKIDTYIEPFVGGGAVFFHIIGNYPQIKHFYLFDINQDLVNCYNAIKDNVEDLISELCTLQKNFLRKKTGRKDFFYQIRAEFNFDRSVAKLIFLNKTCFNGLYRVNRSGFFNVPFGDYKNPAICDEDNLRSVSETLQKADVICGDFEDSEKYVDKNSFVYFDPPYRPISQTAGFTSYTKEDFEHNDQVRLSLFCKKITDKGAKLLLSNSDPKNENQKDYFFQKNYPKKLKFQIETVKASRVINCKGTKRGQINELIITNY